METPRSLEVPSNWSKCELIFPNPNATAPIAYFFNVNHGLAKRTEVNKVSLSPSEDQDGAKKYPGVTFATDLEELAKQGVEVVFY
ncbi:MAG: hypothetical protein Q8P68_03845 [Candidatus Peregrinibacteria bacterium]|nr:hypothetical protein [Candidatus Peregrinibacteria bacterium]MDZ4245432.1 hypothetical protein [Candidatus Gracilibacteria bacterium]